MFHVMDHVALLVDPMSTPAQELRRFQEYFKNTADALTIAERDLESLLATAAPINEVGRYNLIRDAALLRQGIDDLRRTLSQRSEQLETVRHWVLSAN